MRSVVMRTPARVASPHFYEWLSVQGEFSFISSVSPAAAPAWDLSVSISGLCHGDWPAGWREIRGGNISQVLTTPRCPRSRTWLTRPRTMRIHFGVKTLCLITYAGYCWWDVCLMSDCCFARVRRSPASERGAVESPQVWRPPTSLGSPSPTSSGFPPPPGSGAAWTSPSGSSGRGRSSRRIPTSYYRL